MPNNQPTTTYGDYVQIPPGTLIFSHLGAMRDSFGSVQYDATVEYRDEESVRANKKVYDKFMAALYAVVKEAWGYDENAAGQAIDSGDISSPFKEGEYKGVPFLRIEAKLKKVQPKKDGTLPTQRHPKCFKLLGGNQREEVTGKESIETEFYPGAFVSLKVQLYATQTQGKKYVRCYLAAATKIADGKRLAARTDGDDLSDDDMSDLAGSTPAGNYTGQETDDLQEGWNNG